VTEKQARTTANVVMAAAALGAAVFVLRSPKLRRLAWQLAGQYATGPLAVWTATTVRQAWDDSASGPLMAERATADWSAGSLPARTTAERVGEAIH
jgi:hypothetical protein